MSRHRHTSAASPALVIGLATAIGTLVLAGGCTSAHGTGEPATLIYVGSPDDTWTAIHIALADLGYDVEREDRNEGTIRAVRQPTGDQLGSVLTIDQIWRQETISIYVRAFAADGDPELTAAQRDALTQELLDPVRGLLYK